jgi:hypothetical protein
VREWLRRILDSEEDVQWVMNNVRNAKRRTLKRGRGIVLSSYLKMGRAYPHAYGA